MKEGLNITYRPHTSDLMVIQEVYYLNCYQYKPEYAKDGIILDIGANIGAFSLLAGEDGATVHAYEPEPHNYELLVNNLKSENITSVTPYNVAVGKPGTVNYIEDIQGSSHLSFTGAREGVEVTVVGLDEIVTEPVGFMKMDCEGSEYDIIKYASDETLKKIKRIAIEFHPWSPSYHTEISSRLLKFYEPEILPGGLYLFRRKDD